MTRVRGDETSHSSLAPAARGFVFDVDALRIARDGRIWLGDEQISEPALRSLLAAHGLPAPKPTKATYDTTTDGRTGWGFVVTPKWTAALVVAAASAVGAIFLIVNSLRSIHTAVGSGDAEATGSLLVIVLATILYLVTGLAMCAYAFREKYGMVNRLDPKTWIRELRRLKRLAEKPLTDGEIEDAILDLSANGAAPESIRPPRLERQRQDRR